jgi:hypothetical protein
MFRNLLAVAVFLMVPALHAAPPEEPASWLAKVAQELPLLGHRNWILIVDSAYPLQVAPGVETVDTRAPLTAVLPYVLGEIENSEHVRPDIYMDAELPFVTDQDAPGTSQFRANIADILHVYPIQTMPHDKLIGTVNDAGKTFQILVLKTNMTIPYSSVFIQLKAKYWGDDAEARLRAKMGSAQK